MKSAAILQKLSLRSLAAHKLRLILTLLAVVLGTSFVAGGFILAASLSKAFDDITYGQFEGADVVVNSTADAPVSHDVSAEIAARPDVDKVEESDILPVIIVDKDNNAYQSGGAGSWVMPYVSPEDAVTEVLELVDGRAPEKPGEAVLNDTAADKAGLTVGDSVTLIDAEKRTEFELVGISNFSSATGGWAGVQVAPELWNELYSDGLHTGQLYIRGDVSVDTLKNTYPGFDIVTAEAAAEEQAEEITEALSFFTYILLAFGLIALLVGTFIISNTFSMIVAQRTKEFALLRALGMSRPQLTTSVLVEAAAVGVVGSLLGIAVGAGLVRLIVFAMDAAGLGFPDAGLGLNALSVAVPVGVGVTATVLSAWVPARRAGAVHPVQAMRMGDQSSTRPVKARSLTGLALVGAGVVASLVAALLSDWATPSRTVLVGAGTIALIFGVLLLMAGIARGLFTLRPPSRALIPLLAGTNLSRNPRRTAATAFALTLGVALVAAVGILGASMKTSIFGAIEEDLHADAVVTAGMITTQGVPLQAVHDAENLPGVESVYPSTWAPLKVSGLDGAPVTETDQDTTDDPADAGSNMQSMTALLDPTAEEIIDIEVVSGSFADSESVPGVGLSQSQATTLDVTVGDDVLLSSPLTARTVAVPVLVVWEDSSAFTPVAVSPFSARDLLPENYREFIQQMFISFEDGADKSATHEKLVDELNSYGVLQVMTKDEFRVAGAQQVNQLMMIVYALLALSVIIAVLGIINTLALSIMERTHEFGMLRAVGMQRAQIRRMITTESLYIALLGTSTGIVAGAWLGWCFVRTLSNEGVDRWAIPWGQLVILLIAALLVGGVAAIWPGIRAARTSPLAAVG